MGARGRLTCRPPKHAPSRTAREIIDRIRRTLECGATPEEIAQARADQEALKTPRQPELMLRVAR